MLWRRNDESEQGDSDERAGVTSAAGRWPRSRSGSLLTSAGMGSDGSGPYASAFARLASAGYPVVDGFIVRPVGADRADPAGLDGVGREEIATQLGTLELRHDRRLGATSAPLRLAVLSLPRTPEVPILSPTGPAWAPRPVHVVAREISSIDALIDALRATTPTFARRTVIVTVVPDDHAVGFTGTLVTRHPQTGTIDAPAAWIGPHGRGPGVAPPRELQSQCDHIASAAEAACTDMCHVSVAAIDGAPVVTAITPAPRSPLAALRVAVELRDHGLIPSVEALRRVPLSLFALATAGSVPAAASTDITRLLRWADKATSVPVLRAADVALPRVLDATQVDALPHATEGVAIVPSGDPETVAWRLHEIAGALDSRGIDRVALELNDRLRAAATTSLPALPWRAVVGAPDDPAARILAARLGSAAR